MPGQPVAQDMFSQRNDRIAMHALSYQPRFRPYSLCRYGVAFGPLFRMTDHRHPGIAFDKGAGDPAGFVEHFDMFESGKDFLPQDP